ncbi:DUF4056 domain-containing protein [Prolixibacteraceae bacterium Z1-6]|uniref:DUF4056 domain-containing protein n=1 Tax=Draconibacterium aestuarii TaxID=2998507 RepID=A0A9X3J7J4_9BACT|nr:DUF4056 domain-containing protein [Prolixibacteraceae bacterium Z1-6]
MPFITRIVAIYFFLLLAVSAIAKAPHLSTKELATPPPRIIRACCSFGVDLSYAGIPFAKRNDITSISQMGEHHYLGGKEEGNGIIYTKRGGFIDLGHMRDCADWTAYLYKLIQSKQENPTPTLIALGTEGGTKTLELDIPSEIDSMVIYQVAGKIAYELSLWHEIATWFGVSYIPMLPERYSSFSPEDLYSNLLGVELGINALKSDLDYNDAMTQLINQMMVTLEAVTSLEETHYAMEEVENFWWTRTKSLPNKKILIERYTETDCYLLPWLVPSEINILPAYKLMKPEDYLSDFYELKIKLNHKFPLKYIMPDNEKRTITQNDFGRFITYIDNDLSNLTEKMLRQTLRKQKRKDLKLNTVDPSS